MILNFSVDIVSNVRVQHFSAFILPLVIKPQKGCTPLCCAAKRGLNSAIIEMLVQYGANVDEEDREGYTPLHFAAKIGKKSTVETLLKYKAKHSIRSKSGNTILHSAAEGGNIELVEVFLELCGTSDLHEFNDCGYTPLHCAVDRGHNGIIDLLIKRGSNVDGVKDQYHLTPLHVAADKNREDATELLLKAGATLHASNKFGRSPLHYAAKMGHEKVVKVLLKYCRSHINEKDIYSFTPLHLAVGARAEDDLEVHSSESSPEATVRILISNGAKVNEQNQKGHTPLHYAKKVYQQYDSKIVQMLSNPSMVTDD